MAKVIIYLKVAKTRKGYRVVATNKPSQKPITDQNVPWNAPTRIFPTVSFGIQVNIPDKSFDQAIKIIGKIDYRVSEIGIPSKVDKDLKVEISEYALKKLKG